MNRITENIVSEVVHVLLHWNWLQPFRRNYDGTTQHTKQHRQVAITFILAGLHITQPQVAVSLDLRINASGNINGESLAAEYIRRA